VNALAGRTALVTGASRGIGRAIALAFAAEGADVALSFLGRYDRERPDPDAVLDVARAIEEQGRGALVVEADVAREDDVQALADRALDAFGRIDVLVNNAGFVTLSRVENMNVATWDETIAAHLAGHVPRHAGTPAADARARRRPHHQRRVADRADRPRALRALRCGEGGDHRLHEVART
jgi:NAD(P)-dependent dehydrogenase (short-subunit alcohol dehydrogenase family)